LPNNNILSVAGIIPHINNSDYASKIHIYDTLESTNKTAKEMAINGCEHGTVVIADAQTSGKGKYRHKFYSPPSSGLYMSIVFRTETLQFLNLPLITPSIAVTVCRAIEAVSGKQMKIKWINDIFFEDRKVCGILTEAITDFESGNIDWVVVGMGINVNNRLEDFPEELSQIAGSIYPDGSGGGIRNQLAADIINRCSNLKVWLDDGNIYNEYRERSTLLGHRITVTLPSETYEATAIDMDINGHLIIRKDNGEVMGLSSGKVSIKHK